MRSLLQNQNLVIQKVLFWFSSGVVPIALVVATVLAYLSWAPQFPAAEPEALIFQAKIFAPGASMEDARAELVGTPEVNRFPTRLSEEPVWYQFQVPARAGGVAIELPSRHAFDVQCWSGSESFGSAHRNRVTTGRLSAEGPGFVFRIGPGATNLPILCRTLFAGPGRLEVNAWDPKSFEVYVDRFSWRQGILEGAIAALFCFVLITALITKDGVYFVFAAWLLCNLRMAALSAGADFYWFEHVIPSWLLYPSRKLTLLAYFVVSITLFSMLLSENLTRRGHRMAILAIEWASIALIGAALVLPYGAFLKLTWALGTPACLVAIVLSVRVYFLTRSPVAAMYAGALTLILCGNLAEIGAAALNADWILNVVNSVTAAAGSSLLAALAVGHRIRTELEQKESAERALEATYNEVPIGLFTADRNGRMIRINPAMAAMLNTPLQRPGSWDSHFVEGAFKDITDHLQAHNPCEYVATWPFRGSEHTFAIRASLAENLVEGSLHEITEAVKATRALEFLANHDPLTECLNRRGIEQAFQQFGFGGPNCVAYLDLDRFKIINDTYGHATGDEVLRQICRRIADAVRGEGSLGRMGGDEFIVVFATTPISVAVRICRKIIDEVGQTLDFHDKAVRVSVGVGLIEIPKGMNATDAISAADRACRSAKEAGTREPFICRRDSRIFLDREAERVLVHQLDNSENDHGLFLAMQPILSLERPFDTHNWEALVRMRAKDGQVLGAGKVIGAAESNGRISTIDRWVLRTMLHWLEVHADTLRNTRFVCLNLSGGSLNDERFIADALAMMNESRRAASMLCLELTESIALKDINNTRRFIERVKQTGARVALDDFGAGYASYSYLKNLPVDVVKLDGSIVRDVALNPLNAAIVASITKLATDFGMRTIAEWAEDVDCIQALAEAGINYVQGFAVAYPQSPAEILQSRSSMDFVTDPKVRYLLELVGSSKSQVKSIDIKRDLH